MRIKLLTEETIRKIVDPAKAVEVVRDALELLARGMAVVPAPTELDLRDVRGEMHIKGAYLKGSPFFSFKASSGFYENATHGLPTNGGLVLVFDAVTGFPVAVLFDNGHLTNLRTGAAGAVAADLLAKQCVGKVAIIGAGAQARCQLEALVQVRQPAEVSVWARQHGQSLAYAVEMSRSLGVPVAQAPSVQAAVVGADIVVTTTSAREPLVNADWLGPGQHVTAVGADLPDKQELDPRLFALADKVVVDSLTQAVRSGDTHHAIASGLLAPEDIHSELGPIVAGLSPGRESETELTIADLTGLGVEDAAIANLVFGLAQTLDVGDTVDI